MGKRLQEELRTPGAAGMNELAAAAEVVGVSINDFGGSDDGGRWRTGLGRRHDPVARARVGVLSEVGLVAQRAVRLRMPPHPRPV